MRQRPPVTPGTIKCVHITHPVITRQPNPGNTLSPSTATVSVISHWSWYLVLSMCLLFQMTAVSRYLPTSSWTTGSMTTRTLSQWGTTMTRRFYTLSIVRVQSPASQLRWQDCSPLSPPVSPELSIIQPLLPSSCPWTPSPSSFSLSYSRSPRYFVLFWYFPLFRSELLATPPDPP